MFILINNKDESAIKIEGEVQRARNDKAINPEFAMDVLSKTNHRSNIKKLVKAIKDKCTTKDDILPFREFILSCVDGREMSCEVREYLTEMAELCDCKDDFLAVDEKTKFFGELDCTNAENPIIIKNMREFSRLMGNNLKVYFDVSGIMELASYDLSRVKQFGFSEASFVRIEHLLDNVNILSTCSQVGLYDCDLGEVGDIKFKKGATVILSSVKNLPNNLDVSECKAVHFHDCNVSPIKELKFMDGAKVWFSCFNKLPDDLDVSNCSMVSFYKSDLKDVRKLKFRKGAKVEFFGAKNLPKELDVSECEDVCLKECNLKGVKKLCFKDETQMETFMEGAVNFRGKLVYMNNMQASPSNIFDKVIEICK